MPEQQDFPSEWACSSPGKGVKVEVLLRDENEDFEDQFNPLGFVQDDSGNFTATNWIEIPTTYVEEAATKDGLGDLKRAVKVKFPMEWAGASVMNAVQNYAPETTNDLQFARIWFWHQTSRQWVLRQFGFIGGVGPASKSTVGKMWVYDMAELLKGVAANFRFNNPTYQTVVEKVCEELNTRTPAQLVDPLVIGPETEEEVVDYIQSADTQIEDDLTIGENSLNIVGDTVDAVEDVVNPFDSFLFDDNANEDDYDGESLRKDLGIYSPTVYEQVDDGYANERAIKTVNEQFATQRVKTDNIPFINFGSKNFKPNRDTLADVMNWVAEKASAKWHIEPTPEGGTLILDVQPTRRPFVQDKAVTKYNGSAYDQVRVIKNTALYDMNPINTVVARGDFARTIAGIEVSDLAILGDIVPPSKEYPYVEAYATPLLDRAKVFSGSSESAQLRAPVVEADGTTISEVEATATRELSKILDESAEGEITMYGNPKLLPYDKLVVVPTCSGHVQYTNVQPMVFEVQEVVNTKESGGFYKTTVEVSLMIEESDIETESELKSVEE